MRLHVSAVLLSCLATVSGCADSSEPSSESVVADDTPVVDNLEVLARVERGGNAVEWVRPRGAPIEAGAVVIRGRTGEAPMIDMDTAEAMRPVELYLALAADARIPLGLAPIATDEDRALAADPVALTALRDRTARRATQLAAKIASDAQAMPGRAACTSTEIATARSVYGTAYTSQSTCGDHLGFADASRGYTYCNGGAPDCDYPLGRSEINCTVTECDYVEALLRTRIMRSNTGGNPHFVQAGHRLRGFAYNCTGDGDLTMRMRYGDGDWDIVRVVPVNTHTGFLVWGSGHLPARAIAIDLVANGNIFDGIPASGSTYRETEYLISGNAGANDHGIFCSDVQKSLTMGDASNPQSCGHGFVSWCTDVCGGCFQ